MLAEELERLVGHLGVMNRTVASLFLPGIDADRVSAVLGEGVPASVAQWFGWCNGVTGHQGQLQDDVNLIPGYNPLSIEEAVRVKGDYSGDSVLGKSWVPLLGGAGGDLYAAVWSPGTEAVVAGVLIGEPTEVEFTSIEQMVAVFNGCFQGAAYFVNEQGYLVMDPDRYDEIYAQVAGQ